MAKQQDNSSSGVVTNNLTKGLNKDFNSTFSGEGSWTHARNAVNNSHDGNIGTLSTEPSNFLCLNVPYTVIGAIDTEEDQWVIFSTNNTDSEIGLFDESKCTYVKLVNDPCLNFKTTHLITGAYRSAHNCGRRIYWDDALNPSRYLEIDNIPRLENGRLDCEKLRLAPLLTIPELRLSKAKGSGTLPNGSYQVALAYTADSIRITDYVVLSNVQSLFDHQNLSGSLELNILDTDEDFDEMEIVVISTVNANTVAKRLGIYSTRQSTIYIDTIDPALPTIPLDLIPLRTPAVEKSDKIFKVNNYLLRVGIYSKVDFNYQPQANKIKTKWVSVEYPADYYRKGGNNVGYMRDEQYTFQIRWIYNTGDKSASYHIPGRFATSDDLIPVAGTDAIEILDGSSLVQKWQVYNTASIISATVPYTLPDGGKVIAEGEMGYWQSTEKYPDNHPEVWDSLSGKNIRHHKFPDHSVSDKVSHFNPGGNSINILGVKFEGITHPLDNDGNPIESIVGYEILRGSREGQKTVIAKGMINNMREYSIVGSSSQTGLFQNYPYNDLRPDKYLTPERQTGTNGKVNPTNSILSAYRKDIFSFHSPEVSFSRPFLAAGELKVYQELRGKSLGRFEVPYKHPKFKIFTNFASILGKLIGLMSVSNIFAQGVTIAATEDLPIGLTIGPISKPPQLPPDFYQGGFVVGMTNPATTAINYIQYGLEVAKWAVDVISIATSVSTIAQLNEEKMYGILGVLIPRRQYAAQYNSHGFYNDFATVNQGNTRRQILDANYLGSNIQSFSGQYQVNNLFRSNSVVLSINDTLANPSLVDDSRKIISEASAGMYEDFECNISSYYTGLKVRLNAQYGQLESIKQIPISSGITYTKPVKGQRFNSEVFFGGDTYINRFSEKNTFFFFYDWLLGQPDEYEYDYTQYINIPYPRFWVHNAQYHSEFLKLADDFRSLDKRSSGVLHVKEGYFYLFNSGVRDFFVESEVNLAQRDWDDEDSKRHYDPYEYTDLSMMFRSDIIKSNNYYKYDYSLSNSKLFNSYISWANFTDRDFDPAIAESCYSYYPKRIMYSLPQEKEFKRDNWQSFLPNNYKDFSSEITSIKPINKTGALIMMKNESPIQLMGVDTLETGAGVKITIGDGGLFNQPLQNIVNADRSYQYGSCQNKYAVAATPYGVFYVSQQQGKIFNYAGDLDEISKYGNKWWFSRYLPSELLKRFPEYPLFDNPVDGIGCQIVYDNTNDVVYFTKKDYKPLSDDIKYDPEEGRFYASLGYSVSTTPPEIVLSCPTGYTLVGNQCQRVESTEPTGEYTSYQVAPSTWYDNGTLGTAIYSSFNSDGTGTFNVIDYSNGFWFTPWEVHTDPSQDTGPVNRIAVWNADGLTNYGVSDRHPLNTWVGFDVCINVPTTKTYYVALAADNQFRMSVDGTIVLTSNASAMGANHSGDAQITFKRLHIYPITLTAGNHILKLEGYNHESKASFGAEIYDNTPQEIEAATSYSDLNVIFTTRDQTEFKSGTFTCPPGYDVDTQICDEPECNRTVTTEPIVTEIPGNSITKEMKQYIDLDNRDFFEDASWTISYDPKLKMWISFHDWHPTFVLPGQNHFMTVLYNGIWKHNMLCDSFCNFYGVDYPFEIEFIVNTGQTVTSLRSVEYLVEAYEYGQNCQDKNHQLDYNFDRAIVYNSEQISGMLKLNLTPKNNPVAALQYPIPGSNGIDILYSKEENKYRFNQFYDITRNRGEFSYTNVPMFLTSANGYVFRINPNYVDYTKGSLERKKLRHNNNRIFLRKIVNGKTQLVVKLFNTKTLLSLR